MKAINTYKISDTKELKVFYDECDESPRTMHDNIAHMICFHKRYNLGDKHDLREDAFDGWVEVKAWIEENYNVLMIKPLYLYDHGGITISTGEFSCNFDSGMVGFVFIANDSDESLAELFEDRLNTIIEAEVKEYDTYLRGDVYGFQLIEKEFCESCGSFEEKILDSCWGFYGYDIKENGILEHLDEEDRKAVLSQI